MDIFYTPGQITGNAKSYKLESVTFRPGYTPLSQKQYDRIAKHPKFARLVSEGVFVVTGVKVTGVKVEEPVELDGGIVQRVLDLPYRESIELIDTITDHDVLLELKNSETRVRVIAAIDEKLENDTDKTEQGQE